MSVPSPAAVQASFAETLVDEWRRLGVVDAVLGPGSRSTPVVLALARDAAFRVHVRIDERSGAFFALGRALETGRPVVMLTTSGTAAAEVHAAVSEADAAGVPLIVATADRPPELHGVGAPQTMDQRHLYGAKVRLYEEPGVARWDARHTWRDLAARAVGAASGSLGRPGPVHLNLAFTEPLVSDAAPLPPARSDASELTGRAVPPPRVELAPAERGLCVVGAGVHPATIASMRDAGWAVLGDATAQGTIAHFDALLRDDDFATSVAPDVVVRLGGAPASKVLSQRLVEWAAPTVAFTGAGPVADPDRVVSRHVAGLPLPMLGGSHEYRDRWAEASGRVAHWLAQLDHGADLDEPGVARAVVAQAQRADVALVVGSSMPVRDVEWWAPSRHSRVFANRGVNGIDGVVSTLLGVAAGGRAVGLVGDVTFLHDVSALVEGLGDAGGSAVVVVVDNAGGGIFNFLSQAQQPEDVFRRFFATPRALDLVGVGRAFGHHAERVKSRATLDEAIEAGLARDGVSVVVATVPSREDNVARHAEMNDQVRGLLGGA